MNETFNCDGPDWLPDDAEVVSYECISREQKLERQRERYADGGKERKQAYKERDGVREMLRKSEREWYDKNKERKLLRRRELYAENNEREREKARAKYQKHKAKKLQRAREKYWKKKEQTVI